MPHGKGIENARRAEKARSHTTQVTSRKPCYAANFEALLSGVVRSLPHSRVFVTSSVYVVYERAQSEGGGRREGDLRSWTPTDSSAAHLPCRADKMPTRPPAEWSGEEPARGCSPPSPALLFISFFYISLHPFLGGNLNSPLQTLPSSDAFCWRSPHTANIQPHFYYWSVGWLVGFNANVARTDLCLHVKYDFRSASFASLLF